MTLLTTEHINQLIKSIDTLIYELHNGLRYDQRGWVIATIKEKCEALSYLTGREIRFNERTGRLIRPLMQSKYVH